MCLVNGSNLENGRCLLFPDIPLSLTCVFLDVPVITLQSLLLDGLDPTSFSLPRWQIPLAISLMARSMHLANRAIPMPQSAIAVRLNTCV